MRPAVWLQTCLVADLSCRIVLSHCLVVLPCRIALSGCAAWYGRATLRENRNNSDSECPPSVVRLVVPSGAPQVPQVPQSGRDMV
ncbi:hypothetical protein N656DRAFT_361897 [Canariomyces notabilis]|uniref:Uncharacterized protein n=1 Tax=Canariomyces notabilis TaxID=2074819 RepID=A0AAN6T949_9PEZI|nr:hypothetical protein N656DRAFT_361897 [Canariomyces arenarius]